MYPCDVPKKHVAAGPSYGLQSVVHLDSAKPKKDL